MNGKWTVNLQLKYRKRRAKQSKIDSGNIYVNNFISDSPIRLVPCPGNVHGTHRLANCHRSSLSSLLTSAPIVVSNIEKRVVSCGVRLFFVFPLKRMRVSESVSTCTSSYATECRW